MAMDMAVDATSLPRVFLVEDSRLLRERLGTMLAGIAQCAGDAGTAGEAIDAILAAQPDAVVLDLMLKSGSGIDVLRALHERAPQIAVYVLTNYPAPHYRRLAMDLGARGFFDKSTEFNLVRDAIAGLSKRPQYPQHPQ
jgi:DNA-binding NarL/FixJ family response regulator